MKTLKIGGADLACEERGTGELLILVHGAVGDYRTWEGVLDAFAARHRVIIYSRRWHHPDTSARNGDGYTYDGHAADLIELITSCAGPVRLLGHSYGATVCAVVAGQRPDLVRNLVLAEPSLFSLLLTPSDGRDCAGRNRRGDDAHHAAHAQRPARTGADGILESGGRSRRV